MDLYKKNGKVVVVFTAVHQRTIGYVIFRYMLFVWKIRVSLVFRMKISSKTLFVKFVKREGGSRLNFNGQNLLSWSETFF